MKSINYELRAINLYLERAAGWHLVLALFACTKYISREIFFFKIMEKIKLGA